MVVQEKKTDGDDGVRRLSCGLGTCRCKKVDGRAQGERNRTERNRGGDRSVGSNGWAPLGFFCGLGLLLGLGLLGAAGDRAGGGQVTGSRGQGILEPGEQQVLACPGQPGRKLSYGVLTVDSRTVQGERGAETDWRGTTDRSTCVCTATVATFVLIRREERMSREKQDSIEVSRYSDTISSSP